MPHVRDVIVHSLTTSQMILHRYVDDFKPQEWLHRPTPKANCAAWVVGHLTLTERNVLKAFGVTELPPLPDGFEQRFSREEGAPQAGEFGDVSQLMPAFDATRRRLIQAVQEASDELLDKPLERPFPIFKTTGEAANFMGLHVAMHAGQITLIRRSLGYPPVV